MAEARKKTPVRTHSGMSARLLELHGETNDPEPYEVTDTITVVPLTRKRMKELHAAELKKYFANALLSRKASLASQAAPADLPEDATDAQRADYKDAVEEWEKAFDIKGAQRQIEVADEEYERAFFGDAYSAVMEFFEDKPVLWNKFVADIESVFLPKEPLAGADEEQVGKGNASST